MPEGPEVWILSKAINLYFIEEYKKTGLIKTNSYGKHLIINDIKEDWSFGLSGTVAIISNNLVKLKTGWLNGHEVSFRDNEDYAFQLSRRRVLGVNWMNSSEESLHQEINKWNKSKRKLASLILDQSRISGIGVAWGSEILHMAGLRPEINACDQSLEKLADIIIAIREEIQEIYEKELDNNKNSLEEFINGWFTNLYEIREMNIYKKGSKLEVLGRSWWV